MHTVAIFSRMANASSFRQAQGTVVTYKEKANDWKREFYTKQNQWSGVYDGDPCGSRAKAA
ncbi:MAG: hypothetical protein R2911_33880 [Caldilineaceae bacterium]